MNYEAARASTPAAYFLRQGTAVTRQPILVVEDSDDIRVLIKFMLEMKGHRVVEATNGREALERAGEEPPQLILMDLSMPVMDGWEATRRLRQMELTRGVPIVGVTAHCRDEGRELALRAGCDECIPKPLDEDALDSILSRYLLTR